MSRPKSHKKGRVTVHVRLPLDLNERLREAAEERELSANYLATKAIEDFLEHLIPVEEIRLTRERKDE